MIGRTPADTVIYAIGDIHGRLDLLLALQQRIIEDAARRDAQRKLLIYLGDLVSRGPDSRGVVERVRSWLPEGFERVVLRGNHEDLLLRSHAGEFEAARHWLDYGGIEAMASYGVEVSDELVRDEAGIGELCHRFAAALPGEQQEFLEALPLCHQAGDYFFVHGGVRPGVPLAQQNPRDLIWIRKTFLASTLDHGAIVVHGHSISRNPETPGNRIGIDTGAYHSGVLTCLVLDGDTQGFLQTGKL
jgi:serine/threonine protein phosphatase 1